MNKNCLLINLGNLSGRFLMVFAITLFAACGFRPIYNIDSKFGDDEDRFYKEELAAIKVKVERKSISKFTKQKRKRVNQQLKNDLEDTLNPDNIDIEAKYLLTVNLQTNEIPSYITSTGTSGRSSISLNASYVLRDINSGEIIITGGVSASDATNITSKRFAHYTAEGAIELNLAKAVAGNLRNSLISNFLNKKEKLE